jgi:hypothetical protein
MSNTEHKEILKKGVKVWNRWRSANPDIRPDLSRATLKNMDLSGYNLNHSDLQWVIFKGSDLSYCDLTSSNLCDANFEGANLSYADLSNANLCDCDFSNANLEGTIFERSTYNIDTIFSEISEEDG